MKVKLPNTRLAFPALFKAQTVNGEGEPAYSAAFLIPKGDKLIKEIEAAIEAVATEKWGAKAAVNLKAAKAANKTCLQDGDMKASYAGFDGHMYISARSKTRPTVVDRDRTPLSEDDGKVFAGCYVNGIIDIWAMDNAYGKRICAALSGVQYYKTGEAFGGSAPVSTDEFEELGVDDEEDSLV